MAHHHFLTGLLMHHWLAPSRHMTQWPFTTRWQH